jgi:hypothetical protein
MEKITVGTLAICGWGCLGMITNEEPQEVIYSNGSKGMAYVGVHLTNKVAPIGSPWSSRHPQVVGHIDQWTEIYQQEDRSTKEE